MKSNELLLHIMMWLVNYRNSGITILIYKTKLINKCIDEYDRYVVKGFTQYTHCCSR